MAGVVTDAGPDIDAMHAIDNNVIFLLMGMMMMTTMLLIIPVSVEIAVALKLNPLVLLLPEVFASNVGVLCLLCLLGSIGYFLLWHRKDLRKASVEDVEGGILWWALALGACLGGNGTILGASANVVTAGMAGRAGYGISFIGYMKICFVPMVITVAMASVWLLVVML